MERNLIGLCSSPPLNVLHRSIFLERNSLIRPPSSFFVFGNGIYLFYFYFYFGVIIRIKLLRGVVNYSH